MPECFAPRFLLMLLLCACLMSHDSPSSSVALFACSLTEETRVVKMVLSNTSMGLKYVVAGRNLAVVLPVSSSSSGSLLLGCVRYATPQVSSTRPSRHGMVSHHVSVCPCSGSAPFSTDLVSETKFQIYQMPRESKDATAEEVRCV